MSQLANLLRMFSEPLLLREQEANQLKAIFRQKLIEGAQFSGADLHAELGIAMPAARQRTTAPTRIAVVSIAGVITEHANSMGTSTADIGAKFDAAMASSQVDAILLDVDSPGGAVEGVPELAAKIVAARGHKPVIALAHSLAASAAYWLASAAEELYVTPSGQVGSIGVYWVHEDHSRALAQQGVDVTPVVAGKYKTEGAQWAPLSEEAYAQMRTRVDKIYAWFVKDVAANRRDTQTAVRNGYGEGRVLGADEAVKANLADRVATFDEAVARLATRAQRGGGTGGPRADLLRKRLDLGGY